MLDGTAAPEFREIFHIAELLVVAVPTLVQLAGSKLFELVAVSDLDAVGSRQGDEPILLQLGQCPGHRLDRQAEIVGDVASGHWQPDGALLLRTGLLRHQEEEARDLLRCRLAAEQEHLVLGGAELVGGDGQDALCKARHFIDETVESRALVTAERDLRDRLCRIDADALRREAEKLAGREEAGDLPATIGKNLQSRSMPRTTS